MFDGFYPPRYTPIPDDLFDELLPELSGAELKVLLYLMRRTFGFKRATDDVSLTQLCTGIVRADGERQDRGTGLSRETVAAACRGLVAKGCIVAQRNRHPKKGDQPTTYLIRVRGESEKPTGGYGKTTPTPRSETPTGGVGSAPRKGVGFSDPQETATRDREQETETWVPGPSLAGKYSHLVRR